MGRGSTQVLIKKIIESLAISPKTSTEISKETGLDRTAITRYLTVLKESGFVVEEKKGTSKKFILTSNHRKDTYFGLSLDLKTSKTIDSIYSLIQEKWKNISKRKLLKTTAQKIIYQVIEDCKLKIPHGWYIYGGICIKPFNSSLKYKFSGLNNSIIKCINKAALEFSKNHFEYQSKEQQYKKAGKKLYNEKENILKLLYSSKFSKNSMFILQKRFIKFHRETPFEEESYSEIINDYDTLIIDITKEWDSFVDEKNERNFAEFKQKLITSFEALWKMIAMINFKQDLLKGNFYSKKELDEHFRFDLNQAKENLIDICSELSDMIPFQEQEEKATKLLKKIRTNSTKIPQRNQKEKEKIQKYMDEYEEKYGTKALGKKIRKEFNL